jgi:hypothetical protein
MSALEPANKKYRRSWETWGNQMIPSEKYKTNYDQIKWGTQKDTFAIEELTSPLHYKVRISTSPADPLQG